MRLKGSIGVCNAFIVFVFIRRKAAASSSFHSMKLKRERERGSLAFWLLLIALRCLKDSTSLVCSYLSWRRDQQQQQCLHSCSPPFGHRALQFVSFSLPFLPFFLISSRAACSLRSCVSTRIYIYYISLSRIGDANLIITICWAIITTDAGRGH